MSLKDKVVLISGVTGNLGKVVAEKFLEQNSIVVGLHSGKVDFNAQQQGIERRREYISCDITSEDAVRSTVDAVLKRYAKIDFLLNVAGMYVPKKKIENVSLQEWNSVLAVNTTSIFLLTKYILPKMKAIKFGRIVNISAMPGVKVGAAYGAYGISKAVVPYFTEMVAKELKEEPNADITINAIAPGIISDDVTDSSTGTVSKNDIAEMILYLCSSKAKVINGTTINMFGNL